MASSALRLPARAFPLLLAGLLLGASPAATPDAPAKKSKPKKPASIVWLTPAKGKALAKKSGKPILYDFTAEWCGYCRILDKMVFSNPQYAKRIAASFVTVRVQDRSREEGRNKPDVADLMGSYGIRAFPTLAVQKADGTSDELVGFAGEEGTVKFLEKNGMK